MNDRSPMQTHAAVLLLIAIASAGAVAQPLTLARSGKALLPIVVGEPQATTAEQTAAQELKTYLDKISGATFEIVEEGKVKPGQPGIYVGATSFAASLALAPATFGPEESLLRTTRGSLIITGGRPRGTLYAVYELLDDTLGVRWYTPWAERVPSLSTLTLQPMDRRFRPYFLSRDMYTHLGDERMYADHEGWTRFVVRNRMNGLGPPEDWGGGIWRGRAGNHSFDMLVPSDKYFAAHPEYFSEREGKRVPSTSTNGNQLCLTNPEVLRLVIEEVKQDLAQYPQAFYISVSINDGGCATICDCARCREVAEAEGESGLLLTFVNQVADAIRDQWPDKYILTLAYNPTADAPKRLRARDNVIVFVCTGGRSALVSFPRGTEGEEFATVRAWGEFARHVWVWDYATGVFRGMHFFRPATWQMYDQFQLYRRLGSIDGIFQENEFMGGNDVLFRQFYEMDMWLLSRLARRPGQPLDPLVDDFLRGYYGPAAPALRQYFDLVKTRRTTYPYRMFNWPFTERAQQLFDRAEQAAANSPQHLARVRDLRLHLDLATVAWRNDIVTDYLARGQKLERYPFKLPAIRERLLRQLHETQHPYLRGKVVHWHEEGGTPRVTFDPPLDALTEYVNTLCAGKEYVPLPQRFARLPRDRLIDLTGATFARNSSVGPEVCPDPDAALGLVWRQQGDKELPMPIGVWSPDKQRPLNAATTVRPEDVPGPGYHWYEGPRFSLREWCYVYVTNSWRFQLPLWSEYDPQRPNQEWQVWVSAKFTGEQHPYGQAGEPLGVSLDRVILAPVQ